MKDFCILATLLVLFSFSQVKGQQRIVYVNQATTTAAAQQDGSSSNPYSDLGTAFNQIKLTGGDVVIQGQTYIISDVIKFDGTGFNSPNLVVNLKVTAPFTFNFTNKGQLNCMNFAQPITTTVLVKNVNFTIQDATFVANSSNTLVQGNCNFTLQNIAMSTLSSSLISLGSEGNAILRNLRVDQVQLTSSQILIDTYDSRDRLEADYLILNNVHMNNEVVNSDGTVYTMIKSFVQYSYIELKDSFLKGIGFSIKGEKIGGNEKTDITIINSTMRDSTTFFFIESFGITTIKDSFFINASDRALHFFLTDENLSPNKTIITNCTFEGNQDDLEGGALAFQGSKETSYQFSLKVTIQDSRFINNYALLSGGAFAFLLLKNGELTVTNTLFQSNKADEGGGVFHVDKGEDTMFITFTNNTFDSNSAFTGGVFNFEFMDGVNVSLDSNVYTNNIASFEGGVGFLSESQITLSDKNSNSSLNKADFEGGAWSLKGASNVTFENIRFEDMSSFLRGGCIFNSAAALVLKDVTFKNCLLNAIGSSGGALFISEDATIDVLGAIFENNQAESGASITFQSTTGIVQTFDTINVKFDLEHADITATIKSQIQSDNGGLILKNVEVPTLNTPFLSHTSGSIVLQNLQINNVKCASDDHELLTFCIFDFTNAGTDSFDITVEDLTIDTVTSQVPLITSDGPTLSMETVKVSNINSNAEISIADFQNTIVQIDQAQFLTTTSDFIRAVSCEVGISNTLFNNEEKVLETATQTSSQFFQATDSLVSINDTEFRSNSKIYAENGGAIKLSDPTNIQFNKVTFRDNKAIYGGALFIEGTKITGTISGCSFIQNSAKKDISVDVTPGFGGAIYFQQTKETIVSSRLLQDDATLTIEDSTFTENSAYTGGAIFTRGLNFILNKDTFTQNEAVSGGALATEIEQTDLYVDVRNSNFIDNSADLYGASLLTLRADVTRLSYTSIQDGTQTYNKGAPAKLRLKTFDYDDDVLLIADRNTSYLLSQELITLDYDSFSGNDLLLSGVTSGGILSKLLEIAIYDANNNHLNELAATDGNISLSIIEAFYPSKSTKNESSLAGNARKNINNGSVLFLDDMNIFAFPESKLSIQVTVAITHKRLGNLNYVLKKAFQIQLLNCQIGEIFREDTVICEPCKPDFFSLKDPFQTKICENCDPIRATCPGGMQMFPKPGYWRIHELSDNVVECPNPDACLGGEIENEKDSLGFCEEGYTGNACATCITGWGKFGDNDECTNCHTDKGYYAKLFVLLGIQISLIIFNVYSNLGLVNKRTPEDYRKEEITIYQSTVVKILVDYAQVLGIVASIDIAWPSSLGDFGSIISKSVPSSKDAFSLDCFFSLAQGTNEHLFFYKILAVNIQPLLYFFFGTFFWIVLAKVRKQSLRNNTQFKDNLLVTNTLIAYILQPEIVKTTLQLFKCVNLGPTDDEQSFVQKDMQIECGAPIHLAWALGLGVPSLVMWLAFPVTVFSRVMWKVDRYNNDATMNRYHFIFKRYRKDKIYWDLNIIMRKALLIIFLVFLSDLYSQIFFSFAVFIFSLHLHYKKRPYLEESLNDLETLGLISNCFLLFGGLFFIEDEDFGVVHGILMGIAFLVNLVFLYKVVKAFWLVFKHKAKTALKMIKGKLGKSPRNVTGQSTPKPPTREGLYAADIELPKPEGVSELKRQKEEDEEDEKEEEEDIQHKEIYDESKEEERFDEIPLEPAEEQPSPEDSLILVSAKNRPKEIVETEGPEDPTKYEVPSKHRDI